MKWKWIKLFYDPTWHYLRGRKTPEPSGHSHQLVTSRWLRQSFHAADCQEAIARRNRTTPNAESLLVVRVGEGTSAGFAVVMETSHHSVEARRAAFTVVALRVVLTALHTNTFIIIILIFPINFCECKLLLSHSFCDLTWPPFAEVF